MALQHSNPSQSIAKAPEQAPAVDQDQVASEEELLGNAAFIEAIGQGSGQGGQGGGLRRLAAEGDAPAPAGDDQSGDLSNHPRTFTDKVYQKHQRALQDTDTKLTSGSHKWGVKKFQEKWVTDQLSSFKLSN